MKLTVISKAVFSQQLLDAGVPRTQLQAALEHVKQQGGIKTGQLVTLPDQFVTAGPRAAVVAPRTRPSTGPATGQALGVLGAHAFTAVELPASRAGKPAPPYQTFDGWETGRKRLPMRSPDKTASFEPSAVASFVDPNTQQEKLLVLNDFYDPTQYQYTLTNKDTLAATPRAARAVMTLEGSSEPYAPKFEAVSRLPGGRFIATTPFNRDGAQFRRVVTFDAATGRNTVARPLAFDAAGLERYISKVTRQPWVQIEGLGVDGAGKNIFFGVRFSGKGREAAKTAEVLLVRCPLDGDAIGAPASHIRLSTHAALGRREGLADIQRDPRDGSYLLLTSHEGDDVTDLANNQGHLFRLRADLVEGRTSTRTVQLGAPLATFGAKPEGVTTLKDGRIVVIFDDDREWKDNFKDYARSQAMFTVLNPDGTA